MWQVKLFSRMRHKLKEIGLGKDNINLVHNTLYNVLPLDMDLYRSERSTEDEGYFYFPIICIEGNKGVIITFHVFDQNPPILHVDDFNHTWLPAPE